MNLSIHSQTAVVVVPCVSIHVSESIPTWLLLKPEAIGVVAFARTAKKRVLQSQMQQKQRQKERKKFSYPNYMY